MSNLAGCFVALENELGDAIVAHRPRLVLTEAPLEKQQTAARLMIGLANVVLMVCYRFDVRCREQSVNTMRRQILGTASFADRDPATGKRINGSMNAKRAVLAWCHSQGWLDVTDDNEADARLCWAFGRREMLRRRALRDAA
jgi:hypothetical protein